MKAALATALGALALAASAGAAGAAGAPAKLPATSHNLWDIRAKDRKGFTLITMALDAFPHPTLLYLKWQAETGEPNAYHLFDGHAESVKFEWV